MKLAICCTMLKRFSRKGVYNSQEIGLGRALVSMGHDVVIYKGTDDKTETEDVLLEWGLKIRYLYLPHLGAHGFLSSGIINKKLDAMLCFSDQQIFIRHIWQFCKKNRIVFVPYIGTAHSMYLNSVRGSLMNRAFAVLTLPIYRKIPVLAKTDKARSELIQLGVKKENIHLAYVGLDITVMKSDFESEDRDIIRKELGYSKDQIVLCTVARLEPDKRPEALLNLFEKVRRKRPFRLLIVGQGPLRKQIDEKIRNLGMEEEVKILDRVPYDQMWRIYLAADYYLNMSRREIFGMAIMEAVYYQTSVAAIRALGPSVTLRDMPGHKLCENDDEIAEWIQEPYPDKEDLRKSAEKLIRDFSWNHCAEVFLEVVQKQMNKGR